MITIRAGFTLAFDCRQPTPMLLLLKIHPSRRRDLLSDECLVFDPPLPTRPYVDPFDNACIRILAPAGRLTVSADVALRDSGRPDPVVASAVQHEITDLPSEVLPYLLGSRYCETDRLSDLAWELFGDTAPGWSRVQAVCDFVHRHISFDAYRAPPRRTAADAYRDRLGVCRDFAHLAIAFCRCLNVPARYCTGYLGGIGVPPDPAPMDFSAWIEVWLGGRWYAFDPRHNTPRIGRILMATGRDATDVAFSTSFGAAELTTFEVVTEEIPTPAKLLRFPETGPALRLSLPVQRRHKSVRPRTPPH